jgi:O-antigen ligase
VLTVIAIDVFVIVTLVGRAARCGIEGTLAYATLLITILPDECRIEVPVLNLHAHRIVVVVLAVLFFRAARKRSNPSLPLKGLIKLHLLWVLISTCSSIVFWVSVKQGLAQLIEYYFLYYVFVRTITRTQTIFHILYAFVTAMTLCSFLGLLEVYARWSILSIFPAETRSIYGTLFYEMFDRGIRSRATFVHPIHFASALAMVIPFAFYLLTLSGNTTVRKVFLNVSLAAMFWALYKTGSRGPWLAAALGIFVLVAFAASKIRRRVIAVGALGVVLMIVRPGIWETLVNMYNSTFDPASRMGSSYEYRPILFRTVKEVLHDNVSRALVGYGLGSFREKGLVLKMPGFRGHRWYTCDSTWILFWYETGYVGLFILAAILLRPAYCAWRDFRRLPKSDRYLSLVFVCSMLTFYVVMASVAIYGWGQNGHMLWIIIASAASYGLLKQDEVEARVLRCRENMEPSELRRELVGLSFHAAQVRSCLGPSEMYGLFQRTCATTSRPWM